MPEATYFGKKPTRVDDRVIRGKNNLVSRYQFVVLMESYVSTYK